jgi:hypothetical protein
MSADRQPLANPASRARAPPRRHAHRNRTRYGGSLAALGLALEPSPDRPVPVLTRAESQPTAADRPPRLFASEARVQDLTVHHARPPCGPVDGALWFQRRPSRVSAGVAAVLLHREALVDGATRAQLPVACEEKEFVVIGRLLAYGPKYDDMLGGSAIYVSTLAVSIRSS